MTAAGQVAAMSETLDDVTDSLPALGLNERKVPVVRIAAGGNKSSPTETAIVRTLPLPLIAAALLLAGCAKDEPLPPSAEAPAERDDLVLEAARAALEVPATQTPDFEDTLQAPRDLAVAPLAQDDTERLRRDRLKAERIEVERKAMAALERAAEIGQRTQGQNGSDRLSEGIDE